jgi:hypothetical protein
VAGLPHPGEYSQPPPGPHPHTLEVTLLRSYFIKHTVPKIQNIYSQKWNCVASSPISTFMYLWGIYIFPWLVLSRPISFRYTNVEIGRQNIIILIGNNEVLQFHVWENINRNQTFILDSHRPFICSAIIRLFSVRNVFH